MGGAFLIINLELYRIFITCAEQGSFTLAAKEIGLTQSAVSQAIKQLEGLLETVLFIRSSRGTTLTESGQVLMSRIGGLVGEVNAAQQYFLQLKGLETGNLRIGASDTLSRYLLLEKLMIFHGNYPGISVQVTNRTSGETLELLRRGMVDIGFVNLPLDELSDFNVVDLQPLHDCFVYSKQYFQTFKSPMTPAELANQPLLMLERQSTSRCFIDRWFEGHDIKLAPQIELGSLDLLLDFAEAGLGVAAVVREFTAHRLNRSLFEIALQPPIPSRSVGMLLRKGIPPSAAAKAFMAIIEKQNT